MRFSHAGAIMLLFYVEGHGYMLHSGDARLAEARVVRPVRAHLRKQVRHYHLQISKQKLLSDSLFEAALKANSWLAGLRCRLWTSSEESDWSVPVS